MNHSSASKVARGGKREVSAVACETRGPGFDSSSNQMAFLLSPRVVGIIDPNRINGVILHICVDKKDHS